ncbi:MAG: hypothetical protein ACJ796_02275 [Gemmatimonadaceae bacterium]
MRRPRWIFCALLSGACLLQSMSCTDLPSATRTLRPNAASNTSTPATRTHTEFTVHVNADIYLTCINEVTHWEGTGHVTVDVVTTPTGITSTRIQGNSDESTFTVTRADGTRYYMIGSGSTQRHDFDGPVSIVTIAEPKVFRSASGDILVTNYALVIVFDDQGAPVTVHAVGACP